MRGWTSVGILCPCGPKIVKGRSKCGDCSLATTARTHSFSQNRCPRPRSMWQPRSLRNFFDNKSGAPPATTWTRSIPLTPAFPTVSMARVLVSSVFSLPRRKVMAFSRWTLCVLRPDLCVSIRSHFSRVLCPIKKREHPVSITRFPTWCAVISFEIDKE